MRTSDIRKNTRLVLNKILKDHVMGQSYMVEAVGDKKVFFENGKSFPIDIVLDRFVTEEEWNNAHPKLTDMTTHRLLMIEKQLGELNDLIRFISTVPIVHIAVEKSKKFTLPIYEGKTTDTQLKVIEGILRGAGGMKYGILYKRLMAESGCAERTAKKWIQDAVEDGRVARHSGAYYLR